MANEKILVVDDDANICELLRLYLTKEGYQVTVANDGEEGLEKFNAVKPDMVLLDVMMPRMDGLEVCRRIRKAGNTPVMMLTAKGETFDKVLGLELGADDYMVKPFDAKEVVARIKAVLRRCQTTSAAAESTEGVIEFDNLRLDMNSYELRVKGKVVEAPPKELELQEQENTTLPLLEKQMKEVENSIENMLNAIQAGVLTSSTKARLEKLEEQQKELEVRIAEEKIAKPRLSENQIRFWLTRLRKLDTRVKSHRETLINTFVNAVYLYDEKVLITFNYKDGTKTITFDEIAAKDAPEGNGSDLGCFAPPKNRNVSKYAAVLFYDTFSCYFCFALPSEQLC